MWTKMYLNIEMYLRRGDTCHVGTLIEVSPHHRFYCNAYAQIKLPDTMTLSLAIENFP